MHCDEETLFNLVFVASYWNFLTDPAKRVVRAQPAGALSEPLFAASFADHQRRGPSGKELHRRWQLLKVRYSEGFY
jgi:hypothetical protein